MLDIGILLFRDVILSDVNMLTNKNAFFYGDKIAED